MDVDIADRWVERVLIEANTEKDVSAFDCKVEGRSVMFFMYGEWRKCLCKWLVGFKKGGS